MLTGYLSLHTCPCATQQQRSNWVPGAPSDISLGTPRCLAGVLRVPRGAWIPPGVPTLGRGAGARCLGAYMTRCLGCPGCSGHRCTRGTEVPLGVPGAECAGCYHPEAGVPESGCRGTGTKRVPVDAHRVPGAGVPVPRRCRLPVTGCRCIPPGARMPKFRIFTPGFRSLGTGCGPVLRGYVLPRYRFPGP